MKSDLTPKQLNSVLQSQHYKRQLAVFFYRAELYNFVHPVATLLGAPVQSVAIQYNRSAINSTSLTHCTGAPKRVTTECTVYAVQTCMI